jgi:WD40 repeat protein
LAAGDYGGQVSVWEVATGACRVRLTHDTATGRAARPFQNHTGPVVSLAFTPDGERLISGSGADLTARLWDVASGEELMSLPGVVGNVCGVAVTPDGRRIVVGAGSGVNEWEATP